MIGKLQLFLSCWANELSLGEAIQCAPEWGYDGVEGPADPSCADELAAAGLPYIAEIATGGNYVPSPGVSLQAHLDDLEGNLTERVSAFTPLHVNMLVGADACSFGECVSFYERGIAMGKRLGFKLVWETHRSRPAFSPWQTRDLL
ncbi:MAG: sugar phosphate isomerase/epimerase [Verrucomicrobiales bacterium]|jgi:sugar phosphate isomerase/epimerase